MAITDNRVVVSRFDGRPEAYDVPPDFVGPCAMCALEGKIGVRYKFGEIVMASPIDSSDGASHLVCLGHLPEDIVIYNPTDNTCRSRDGSDVWTEVEAGVKRPFKGAMWPAGNNREGD